MKIVIAGGSGFIGSGLVDYFHPLGHTIVVLSRQTQTSHRARFVHWDGRTLGPWVDELSDADAVINLSGRTVDCIKTPDHCDEILRSRVESTRAIGLALANQDQPVPVWVQMATAHIYGDPPQHWCDESSPFGYGLAPTVGQAWEQACLDTAPPATRTVILRTSFVLGRNGGPLRTLKRLTRCGLGGTVSHGQQGISWIHELDMQRLFAYAIECPDMTGAYLATAPQPVSNKVFMRSLRRAMRMPIGLPAPACAVRVAAKLLLRTDPELALYGRYCHSTRLPEAGFSFQYSDIDLALAGC